jgi:hypothetical protein
MSLQDTSMLKNYKIFFPIFPIPIFPFSHSHFFGFEAKGMHPCLGHRTEAKACRQKRSQIIIIWLGDDTEKSHIIWNYFSDDQDGRVLLHNGGFATTASQNGVCTTQLMSHLMILFNDCL